MFINICYSGIIVNLSSISYRQNHCRNRLEPKNIIYEPQTYFTSKTFVVISLLMKQVYGN